MHIILSSSLSRHTGRFFLFFFFFFLFMGVCSLSRSTVMPALRCLAQEKYVTMWHGVRVDSAASETPLITRVALITKTRVWLNYIKVTSLIFLAATPSSWSAKSNGTRWDTAVPLNVSPHPSIFDVTAAGCDIWHFECGTANSPGQDIFGQAQTKGTAAVCCNGTLKPLDSTFNAQL